MWTRDNDQLLGQILPGGRQKHGTEEQEMQFPGIKLFFLFLQSLLDVGGQRCLIRSALWLKVLFVSHVPAL